MSDINGGQSPNPNGSPIFPGTLFTGPVLAGNVVHSDGTGNLAGVGVVNAGTANVGYVQMAQTAVVTQATNGTVAGVFATSIVLPSQSQITDMYLMVTTAWTGGAATLGIGNTVSATAYTAAGAVTASALGQIISPAGIGPGTNATAIGNWDNVGNNDVQIVVTSTNTGSGVGTLTVAYIQGINNAS